jgi:uncharacterized protein YigE (DUF2233 family)
MLRADGARGRAAAAVLAVLALFGVPPPAGATSCERVTEAGNGYTLCKVLAGEDLRLYLTAPDGEPFGSFDRLRRAVEAGGRMLAFAMNGGMYHPDLRPVGLYVENGRELARLVTRAGPGNFGLLPNGVFCIGKAGFAVIESRRFRARPPACRFASQSGPMLVIEGQLHPRFLPSSTSRHIRNGVGVSRDGRTAWFAISDTPVTFHEFARLFRDRLKTPNALYLDGSVSKLYAPSLGRFDGGRPMGPILAVVAPAG